MKQVEAFFGLVKCWAFLIRVKSSKLIVIKGVLVALWFGYLESWDGAETSLGTFLDPVSQVWLKTKISIFHVYQPKFEFLSSDFRDFWRFWPFSGVQDYRRKVTDPGREICFWVLISDLLSCIILQPGHLSTFGSLGNTLLVVENRPRKV